MDDAGQLSGFRAALADRYTLQRELGRGGMATVYLATDLRLDRPVALKVLHAELGAVLGPERFLTEIRVTANLQHPNILPLFDSGEVDGRLFYTMPYVEGESLRDRLERERQLSVEQALHIAVAIAGALDHAHRKGVVHRDLKPENLLLTADGEPMVADFGIALAISKAGGARITQTGLSLGTPQYMSPEQATGDQVIDGRSDIYSLACVLYEMLAGESPHSGSSPQAVIARIVTEVPRSVRSGRPSVPPHMEAALERALAKVPADRFATAADFADALTGRIPASSNATSALTRYAAGQAGGFWRTRRVVPLAAAALVGWGVAAWLWHRQRTAPTAPTTRLVIDFPGSRGRPQLSQDGRVLVERSDGPGHPLLVRRVDETELRPLAGTEGALQWYLSPDGKSVAFISTEDRLRQISVEPGSAPKTIASISRIGSGTWATPELFVIAQRERYEAGLYWLSVDAPELQRLTEPDSGEVYHDRPAASLDGRTVAFVVRRRTGEGEPNSFELAVAPLDRRGTAPVAHHRLGVAASYPVAFIDRHLLYVDAERSALMALPLDRARERATGRPIAVLQEGDGRIHNATLSSTGTLLYVRNLPGNTPVLVDSRGTTTPLLGAEHTGSYMNPRLSPDGRRLALQSDLSTRPAVVVYDLASVTPIRLSGSGVLPEWSPDGRRVIFSDGSAAWSQPVDGSTPPLQLVDSTQRAFAGRLTPDGRTFVYQRRSGNVWSIWTRPLDQAEPRPLITESANLLMPTVSPDGRWIAYVANTADGGNEVYVRPFPGPGAPIQVSQGGGVEPVWARDGSRLFYRGPRHLIAAIRTPGPEFSIRERRPLFEDTFRGLMPHANYDVTADGERFVMIAAAAGTAPQAVMVMNWFPELRRRLAAAR